MACAKNKGIMGKHNYYLQLKIHVIEYLCKKKAIGT